MVEVAIKLLTESEPPKRPFELTENISPGVEVPTPTNPESKTVKSVLEAWLAISKALPPLLDEDQTVSLAKGEVVAII